MKRAVSTTRDSRAGFSLLEVLLAVALLAGTLTVLGELISRGLENARHARDLTRAQLLCESQLAAITAGIIEIAPVTGAPCESDPEWLYSVQVDPTEEEGLVLVRVSVGESTATSLRRPTEFSLVRWMRDPGVTLGSETATDSSASEEP